ncbi:hypothetical protein B484DRAFT_450212, partial [Ochromonadaceae sp. CCMP2298]
NTISISQIMDFSGIPLNVSMSLIFQMFDLSKAGVLNFREYLIAMWSFLTTDETSMARLCFSFFDVNRRYTLDIGEVKYLVHMLWDFKPSPKCRKALVKLDQNLDGVVSLGEFLLLNKHHTELLSPLRRLKRKIQKKTVYGRFWRQLTSRRVDLFGDKEACEIFERMNPQYRVASIEYLNFRSDAVPPEFIEQWNYIQQRKVRGSHKELPYEIIEKIKPHPMNEELKKNRRGSRKISAGSTTGSETDLLASPTPAPSLLSLRAPWAPPDVNPSTPGSVASVAKNPNSDDTSSVSLREQREAEDGLEELPSMPSTPLVLGKKASSKPSKASPSKPAKSLQELAAASAAASAFDDGSKPLQSSKAPSSSKAFDDGFLGSLKVSSSWKNNHKAWDDELFESEEDRDLTAVSKPR